MAAVTIILITFALNSYCFGVLPKAGCSISVNEHLTDPQALLLLQNDAVYDIDAFPLPEDDVGTLTFNVGETIDIACPGGAVVVNDVSTGKVVVEATCSSGIQFLVDAKVVPFTSIKCSIVTSHTARYTGNTCAGNSREIEIGFNVNNRFIRHITSCFDDSLQHVLYSHSKVSKTVAGSQVNYPRPSFQVGSFYNVRPDSVSTLYTQNGQRKTINQILGLAETDTSVIQPNSNFYLSTGHYVPKAEFVFGAQQRLTFYFVNAAPQWQSFNGGNWNTMEANCRKYAYENDVDLEIYTGSYGVSTLPDVKGDEQELYLWIGDGTKQGIPVPAIYYKVVYEPKSQAGIALVGLNNPYKTDVSSDIICVDVCDQISWLTWKSDNITLGYSYCCEVDDFRNTIKDLPEFTVTSLLVSSSSCSAYPFRMLAINMAILALLALLLV